MILTHILDFKDAERFGKIFDLSHTMFDKGQNTAVESAGCVVPLKLHQRLAFGTKRFNQICWMAVLFLFVDFLTCVMLLLCWSSAFLNHYTHCDYHNSAGLAHNRGDEEHTIRCPSFTSLDSEQHPQFAQKKSTSIPSHTTLLLCRHLSAFVL